MGKQKDLIEQIAQDLESWAQEVAQEWVAEDGGLTWAGSDFVGFLQSLARDVRGKGKDLLPELLRELEEAHEFGPPFEGYEEEAVYFVVDRLRNL